MFVMTFTLIRTPHSWPVAQLLLGALGLVRGEGDAGDVVPTTPRWRVRSVTVPVSCVIVTIFMLVIRVQLM
jgi:hypothetical protein